MQIVTNKLDKYTDKILRKSGNFEIKLHISYTILHKYTDRAV